MVAVYQLKVRVSTGPQAAKAGVTVAEEAVAITLAVAEAVPEAPTVALETAEL